MGGGAGGGRRLRPGLFVFCPEPDACRVDVVARAARDPAKCRAAACIIHTLCIPLTTIVATVYAET